MRYRNIVTPLPNCNRHQDLADQLSAAGEINDVTSWYFLSARYPFTPHRQVYSSREIAETGIVSLIKEMKEKGRVSNLCCNGRARERRMGVSVLLVL